MKRCASLWQRRLLLGVIAGVVGEVVPILQGEEGGEEPNGDAAVAKIKKI